MPFRQLKSYNGKIEILSMGSPVPKGLKKEVKLLLNATHETGCGNGASILSGRTFPRKTLDPVVGLGGQPRDGVSAQDALIEKRHDETL